MQVVVKAVVIVPTRITVIDLSLLEVLHLIISTWKSLCSTMKILFKEIQDRKTYLSHQITPLQIQKVTF
jgi:hypothetical protein